MRRRDFVINGPIGLGLLALLGADAPPPKVNVDVEEPTPRKPVSAAAGLSASKLRPGDSVVLVVRAKMAPTWHINAAGDPGDSTLIPTTLNLKLPDGVSPKGDWTFPAPIPNPAGQGLVYHGDVTFQRTLAIGSQVAPGPIEVTCDFRYQACDPTSCRPPARLTLKAKAEVVSSR